ncbi:RNA polymerase subunit RPO18 [Deerpox virus W-1170-84]|uniref:DNA-directed RNA polymerase 18 kDa subunit n=1 Tax=Deerpox virus (strain W-1170-84) TaxID=305676 RepID=Q08F88_DPV84|nr:RNA polymerase subunit RPO18 [Deerpox virus W-1170-84]AUI80655.1 RNA polymerase subunit RPO18 [White-tailed deer poxvirus]AYC44664.1 RNA polymerase subunit RPO18 [Moosepox virus GoldyGopher14]
MSTFVRKVYLPISLNPHELTLDIRDNIKDSIYNEYLHKESGGMMAKKIEICFDKELPLGEIINNNIVVKVPCIVTYKFYKNGDIVSGTLNIEDESNITVQCGDLICKLNRDSGNVSFSDSKYCFIRNGVAYDNGAQISVVLKEEQQGMNSNFVFLASIIDENNK